MHIKERYSYSKYRDKGLRPQGSARVFVAPKIKFARNPIINFPPKFWGNIFILLLFFSIIWLFLYSPYFRIREITIEGNSLVPGEEIERRVRTNENIFRFNITKTRAEIMKNNPAIEDLAIYRGIPNALKIVILERKPILVWQTQGRYWLIDDAGVVDKEIGAGESTDLLRISDQKNLEVKIGDQIVSSSFISFAKNISDKFFEYTNIKISGFQVPETTFDLYVYTEAGFYVKFDTTRSADKQLSDLKNIIITYRDSIHEYIDVRINGWAYYK